jgi:Tol biopolymer transport system component
MVQGLDERGRFGLFDLDISNGRTRLLAELASCAAFTPDGGHVLYRSADAEDETILSYSVADGSVEALPGSFPPRRRFSLSPDGSWIATIAGQTGTMPDEMYGNQIWLQPVSGGGGHVLWTAADGLRLGRWTTWLPDSGSLLVLQEEPEAGSDMWRLWIVPVDGSEPRPTDLVHEPANFGSIPFDVHPDGKRIVYAEGGYEYQFWALHNLPLDDAD